MANSVDPEWTASSGAVWSGSALFVYAIFYRNFGVRSFRTFTLLLKFKGPFLLPHHVSKNSCMNGSVASDLGLYFAPACLSKHLG